MSRLIFLVFVLFSSLLIQAQNRAVLYTTFKQHIDSIRANGKRGNYSHALKWGKKGIQWAEETKQDSMQATFCYWTGVELNFIQKLDSALVYYDKADSICGSNHYVDLQLTIKIRKVYLYQLHLGEFDKAKQILLEITPLIENHRNIRFKAEYESLWGGYEKVSNHHDKALQHYLNELEIRRQIKDYTNEAIALQNIGTVLIKIGKEEEAIHYLKDAAKILKQINHYQFLPVVYSNLASIFEVMKLKDSSLHYNKLAAELADKYGEKRILVSALVNISNHVKKNDVSASKRLLDSARFLIRQYPGSGEPRLVFSQARKALSEKRYDEAKKYFQELLALCKKSHQTDMMIEALAGLGEISHATKEYSTVFPYMAEAMAYRDSIHHENVTRTTQELEARFQNERKRAEIEKLNSEKALIALSNQNQRQMLVSIAAVLILLVGVAWSMSYNKKKRQLAIKEQEVQQLQHRMFETRQIALRAQMNPHFIFNCMAAIDHYILSNETRLASDLLTSFAALIRIMLEQSERELIPLAQELQSLNLYLQLEQVRFRNKFTYSIEADEDMDVEVPPLLLQPYVENAILHGVGHLLQDQVGEIKIKVDQQHADKFFIMISDNGIGTKRSASINKRNRPNHQSMGTRITEERIELLRLMHDIDIKVSVKDLEQDKQTGTEVNIVIERIADVARRPVPFS